MKTFFTKNKFLLLFLLFLALGAIVNLLNFNIRNTKPAIKTFSNILFDKELRVDAVMDSLMQQTEKNALPDWVNRNSALLDYLDLNEGLIFLVYRNSDLIYWTSNQIAIPDNSGWYKEKFSKLGNTFVEIRNHTNDSVVVVGLISIMDSYPYQNKFLKNEFHPTFDLTCPHSIVIDSDDTENAIYNRENEYLFSLRSEGNCYPMMKNHMLTIIYLIAFIFLLVFGREKFRDSKFTIVQFLIFALALTGVRVCIQVFRLPSFLTELSVFQPKYFAFSEWFPSLGDLLLTVILFTYLIFIFYTKVSIKRFADLSKAGKVTFVGVWWVILLVFSRFAHNIFAHLIIDSNFQYEAYDVLNLSVYSFIGYFILLVLFVGIILIIDKAAISLKESVKFRHVIIGIISMGLFLIGTLILLRDYKYIIPVIFLFSILIYWAHIRILYTPRFGMVVILIAFFSGFATFFIRHQNFKKRIEESKVIAINLSREQDPVAEVIFGDIIEQMKSDSVIKDFLENQWFDFQKMNTYIKRTYFTGYLDRYIFQLTVCNDADSLLLDDEQDSWQYCYGFFSNLLKYNGVETNIPGLYYLKDYSGGLNYFMQVEIPLSGNWKDVNLFFELTSRSNYEVLGYPELLLEKPIGLYDIQNSGSYAKYSKNQLLIRRGNFPYALERDVYGYSNTEFAFFQSEDYDHLLYNPNPDHTVIVSFPTIHFYNILISFTYIFLFLLIQTTLLLLAGNRFTHIVDFHFNIKNRIVFSMMLILLISFVFVGGGTVMYTFKQFEKGQIDILSEKIQSVLVELEHKLSEYQNINQVSPDYINNLLVKFSNVFYSDINLYDVKGNLVGTSRKEIFDRDLTGKRINAIAFRELVMNKKARVVHKEHIGKMEYFSAYVPFTNSENKLLAYLNLPYFSKEILLRQELLRVVVAVINIYAFLIILSIVVAVYISNRLTEPLRMVQQRIRNIDLSKENERINYEGQDEIAELVTEYNRMLEELDKSARLLAKSERESAWREMARQIAHEIKNPLTPMKLSIQLLNKSWDNHDIDFDTRFKRSTKTLIEQIDSLSSIATAFSQFAKMPVARSEKVDVIERINRSAGLFKEINFATLELHVSKGRKMYVRADNERMLQVFNNLFKNAVQAIPADKNGKVIVNISEEGSSVVVEIKDNGAGVPPELENKLFQPNFTTKSSGTGLGLAIVKNIVEEFGGAIWFESKVGKGSSFFISMPVYEENHSDPYK